jgi:hypothetical protein
LRSSKPLTPVDQPCDAFGHRLLRNPFVSIAVVPLVCVAIGSAFAYWYAVSKVDTAIRAGPAVSAHGVAVLLPTRQTKRLPRKPLESL